MWHGRPRPTASRMESSTGGDQMMCPYVAFPGSKGRSYWQTYMTETVGITRRHELSLERHSATGSISPRHSMTLWNW